MSKRQTPTLKISRKAAVGLFGKDSWFNNLLTYLLFIPLGLFLSWVLAIKGPEQFFPESFTTQLTSQVIKSLTKVVDKQLASASEVASTQLTISMKPLQEAGAWVSTEQEKLAQNLASLTQSAPADSTPLPLPTKSDSVLLVEAGKDLIKPAIIETNSMVLPASLVITRPLPIGGEEPKKEAPLVQVASVRQEAPKPPAAPPVKKAAVVAPVVIQVPKEGNWPLKGAISQGFSRYHPAVDIVGRFGTALYPLKEGLVLEVVSDRYGLGKHLKIQHPDGLVSVYGHLNEFKVKIGQVVSGTTPIGTVGLTGRTTGPHLHFEIYQNGKAINPRTILP